MTSPKVGNLDEYRRRKAYGGGLDKLRESLAQGEALQKYNLLGARVTSELITIGIGDNAEFIYLYAHGKLHGLLLFATNELERNLDDALASLAADYYVEQLEILVRIVL